MMTERGEPSAIQLIEVYIDSRIHGIIMEFLQDGITTLDDLKSKVVECYRQGDRDAQAAEDPSELYLEVRHLLEPVEEAIPSWVAFDEEVSDDELIAYLSERWRWNFDEMGFTITPGENLRFLKVAYVRGYANRYLLRKVLWGQ